MNKLSTVEQVQVIAALVEVGVGRGVQAYHNETVRNLNTRRVQCDEMIPSGRTFRPAIWSGRT